MSQLVECTGRIKARCIKQTIRMCSVHLRCHKQHPCTYLKQKERKATENKENKLYTHMSTMVTVLNKNTRINSEPTTSLHLRTDLEAGAVQVQLNKKIVQYSQYIFLSNHITYNDMGDLINQLPVCILLRGNFLMLYVVV